MMMYSDFINFEFGKLHYQHLMTGKNKTVLLLHAFHSSAASYAQVCDLLKSQFNLVCLDLPGHGLSAYVDCKKHSWYYSLDGFTAALIEFIKRMELKNLIIVGSIIEF